MSRRVTTEQGETVSNDLRVDEGVQPTISLLLGIFVAHVVIWIGLVRLVPGGDGVDYPDLGTLGTPWVRQFVIPLLVVLAFQVVVITRLGWWKSVLRERLVAGWWCSRWSCSCSASPGSCPMDSPAMQARAT
jgi:hypothetical protein